MALNLTNKGLPQTIDHFQELFKFIFTSGQEFLMKIVVFLEFLLMQLLHPCFLNPFFMLKLFSLTCSLLFGRLFSFLAIIAFDTNILLIQKNLLAFISSSPVVIMVVPFSRQMCHLFASTFVVLPDAFEFTVLPLSKFSVSRSESKDVR